MDSTAENNEQIAASQDPTPPHAAPTPGLGVRVFQNTAALLGGRVVGLFFSAGTSVLLARFLGRERLGEYGAIYAYLALYGFFATFCLEQILAREISVRRERAAELFRTGTIVALGFSLAGTILAPALAPLFGYSGQLRWLIVIAAVDILITPPLKFRAIIFQVEMRLWYTVAIGLLRQALWLLAIVLLVFGNAAFYHVILARTLCAILETSFFFLAVRRTRLVQGLPRFVASEARAMLKDGLPLVLSTLAVGVYHRIDQVMLHKMSGDQVLGPYVIAVQLTELFSTLPVALMISLFPALSQTARDPERFDRYLRESYRFLLFVVFAACAIVTPVAAPAVELFYGKQFLSTANLLIVLIWSEVPVFFGVVLGNALVARNLQKYMPYSAVAGAVANVLLNLWLIPRYGALGSAWATVVSYCVSGIFFFLLFGDIRRMILPGLRIGLGPLFLGLSITLAMNLVNLAFWWKLLFAATIYGAGALAIGALRKEDIGRLRSMLKLV